MGRLLTDLEDATFAGPAAAEFARFWTDNAGRSSSRPCSSTRATGVAVEQWAARAVGNTSVRRNANLATQPLVAVTSSSRSPGRSWPEWRCQRRNGRSAMCRHALAALRADRPQEVQNRRERLYAGQARWVEPDLDPRNPEVRVIPQLPRAANRSMRGLLASITIGGPPGRGPRGRNSQARA